MVDEPSDAGLRWFRGPNAVRPDGVARPGAMPDGVRAVVVQGVVAGVVQLLAGAVGGLLLAREVAEGFGIALVIVGLGAAIASFVGVSALARGSARAWRLYGGPLDREVTMLGLQGWARRRLRTPEARRWFRAHADARARVRIDPNARGGPPQRPAP